MALSERRREALEGVFESDGIDVLKAQTNFIASWKYLTWDAAAFPDRRVVTACCMSDEKCWRGERGEVGKERGSGQIRWRGHGVRQIKSDDYYSMGGMEEVASYSSVTHVTSVSTVGTCCRCCTAWSTFLGPTTALAARLRIRYLR